MFRTQSWIRTQDASYYKVWSRKIEPRPRSEQTTGPISMKFGMHSPSGSTNGIIEAIFEISSTSRVMGPSVCQPGGSKMTKKFFSIFFDFFNLEVRLRFLPPEKSDYSTLFGFFDTFLRIFNALIRFAVRAQTFIETTTFANAPKTNQRRPDRWMNQWVFKTSVRVH